MHHLIYSFWFLLQWVKSPINDSGGYNSRVIYPVSFTSFCTVGYSAYGVSKEDADRGEQMIIVDAGLTSVTIVNWYDGAQGHYIIAIGK